MVKSLGAESSQVDFVFLLFPFNCSTFVVPVKAISFVVIHSGSIVPPLTISALNGLLPSLLRSCLQLRGELRCRTLHLVCTELKLELEGLGVFWIGHRIGVHRG